MNRQFIAVYWKPIKIIFRDLIKFLKKRKYFPVHIYFNANYKILQIKIFQLSVQ